MKKVEPKDLISVIVPVYNVEPYLKRCVDSIINQTYKKLEIILVDDGSTDKSGEMCDEYKKIDNRIKVIHKKNGGLSDARNVGIKKSTGKYITFVDSDDSLLNTMIDYLYDKIKKHNVDISICNLLSVYNDRQKTVSNIAEEKIINGKEAIVSLLYGKHYFISACGKIFDKSLFSNVYFPINQSFEDINTIYKTYLKCNSIFCSSLNGYYYYIRSNSITTQKFSTKNIDQITATDDMCENICNYDIGLKKGCIRRRTYARISTYCKMINSNYHNKTVEKRIFNYIKKNKAIVLNDKQVSKYDKISIILVLYFRGIFKILWKLKNAIRYKNNRNREVKP